MWGVLNCVCLKMLRMVYVGFSYEWMALQFGGLEKPFGKS